MRVTLLTFTPNPEQTVAAAARLCYSSADIALLQQRMQGEKAAELIQKLMAMGHHSPLEHVSFTFGVEGVSRVLSHQLVRHRIASYSQKSQRYVREQDFSFVIPPSIAASPEASKRYVELMAQINQGYQQLAAMVDKEDARYVLPNACATSLLVTMNCRALHNFFLHRCCNRAQWEIRTLAWKMLSLVREQAPALFAKAGARCDVEGICTEGAMSCGRWQRGKSDE